MKLKKIKDVLKEEIKKIWIENNEKVLDIDNITDEKKLRDDLNLKSIELAVLTVRIEDLFDVDIFENSFPKTFGEICSIVINKEASK